MSRVSSPSEPLWKPARGSQQSNIVRFINTINKKHGTSLKTYEDLYQYSITEEVFWVELLHFLDIRYSGQVTNLLEDNQTLNDLPLYPPPRFFPGIKLNYAQNCLEGKNLQQTAVITAKEGATDIRRYSFADLRDLVHTLTDALRAVGVQRGDRVAGVLCNSIYSVSVLLATAAVGGVYSSTATDMGISGVLDRLKQIEPKVVFFDNASYYNGKSHDLLVKARTVLEAIDSQNLSAFVVIPNLDGMSSKIANPKASTLKEFFARCPRRTQKLLYEQVHFTDPLFVMYSSGTTGPPKCIVHSVGGVLIQMKKEYSLQADMSAGDIYWQYTTTGWMMYQYLVTSLSAGLTIVCLDGSPMVDLVNLVKFIDREKVTHYGTSPRWLSELRLQNISPKEIAPLQSLRCVTSTGSVLVNELFHHFYASWPKRIQLASVSGGTDLMACFFMHNPITPVYAGQLQCIALGMAAKVYDIEGKPIEKVGTPGELVCTRAFPSQPIYFLSDPSGSKYKSAYYETYPGIWHHSDFVQMEPTGGVTMLGRSDGVLNPSGVRFGSAEIYSITEKFPEVTDALCVGQRRDQDPDETVLLFVITKEKQQFTPELVKRLKTTIQKELSPRHVPKHIFSTEGIPITINGKKVELVVKQILAGKSPKVSATIANPEVLDFYKQFVDIESIVKKDSAKL